MTGLPGRFLVPAVGVSLLGAMLGLVFLGGHAATAGQAGIAPARWPAGLERVSDRPGLILAVHPRCPCTRATVANLSKVIAEAGAKPDVLVLAYEPAACTVGEWRDTASLESLRALPGVRVRRDPDARLARGLGMRTSGHTLAYSATGDLAYSGGLTPSRGHEGPCAGTDSLLAILNGSAPRAVTASVYGCPLVDDLQSPGGCPGCNDPEDQP